MLNADNWPTWALVNGSIVRLQVPRCAECDRVHEEKKCPGKYAETNSECWANSGDGSLPEGFYQSDKRGIVYHAKCLPRDYESFVKSVQGDGEDTWDEVGAGWCVMDYSVNADPCGACGKPLPDRKAVGSDEEYDALEEAQTCRTCLEPILPDEDQSSCTCGGAIHMECARGNEEPLCEPCWIHSVRDRLESLREFLAEAPDSARNEYDAIIAEFPVRVAA